MTFLSFDPEELRPIIQETVGEAIAQLEKRFHQDSRVAYSEAEAARMIGLTQRQLAEERREGRIGASTARGGRIRYMRADLIRYLESRRWTNDSPRKE